MSLEQLLELKHYLLKTRETLLNELKTQSTAGMLIVLAITLDSVERQIKALTYN